MRVFVGIAVSENLQEEILRFQEKYKRLPVRWIADKNLHITLVPPWYVREIGEVREIGKKLQTISVAAFVIRFEEIAFGPDYTPRLIWAKGSIPKELIYLQKNILKLLSKQPEKRPFASHITLARFRPHDFQSFSHIKIEEGISWSMRVESVVLFESRLSIKGADYTVLERVTLVR